MKKKLDLDLEVQDLNKDVISSIEASYGGGECEVPGSHCLPAGCVAFFPKSND